ncbi:hypothetical protein [Oceanobacillus caeni]|uniref:hypothetical protein n=1 Tax=Oceanobacillus caeni TaxID=405946 RepID=UPI003631BA28
MNERLEEIKEMNGVINHKNPAWQEEIDWLISRVEELEKHKKLALELEKAYQLTKDLNQRYKQALEEILGLDIDVSIYDYSGDVITIAVEALKGDKP